jgi:hypothetical protein
VFHAAGAKGALLPSTVQLPCPDLGMVHKTAAVTMDGIQVPESLSMHHAEAQGMMGPPKRTFEGDNLMLVPKYRCACAWIPHVMALLQHVLHACNLADVLQMWYWMKV